MSRPITPLGLLLLTSCASLDDGSRNSESAVETALATTVEYDRATGVMTILGPPLRIDPTHATNWRLRHVTSVAGASLAIVLQLYHTDWQYFQSAHSAGEELDLFRVVGELVPRVGKDAITKELYLIDVSPEQLNRWAQTGAEIRISGKTSEGTFTLPAHYVQGFRAIMQRTAAPVR